MSMVKTVAATKWWETKTSQPKATTKSIQTITFSTNSFNDEDRTFIAIASTPIVDRYGDVVQQDGWQLENFLKNPVIPLRGLLHPQFPLHIYLKEFCHTGSAER